MVWRQQGRLQAGGRLQMHLSGCGIEGNGCRADLALDSANQNSSQSATNNLEI